MVTSPISPLLLHLPIQLSQLQLTFATRPSEEFIMRLELEIQNAADIFKWDDSKTALYRTENMRPTLQSKSLLQSSQKEIQNDIGGDISSLGDIDNSVTCTIDFNGQGIYKRSSYISLDSDSLCLLSNANINIKIILVREPIVVVNEAPQKKGAPPPVVIILAETITEISLPLSSLLTVRGSAITGTYHFDQNLLLENVPNHDFSCQTAQTPLGLQLVGTESSVNFKIASDNDLSVSTSRSIEC